jgi:carboxypeptidase T
VLSVSPPVAVDLDRFETWTGAFTVTLAPSTVAGEAVEFLLRTDNGFFVHTDTLRKVFAGSVQAVFTEDGTNLAPFAGPWGTTQATFVSPPSSITDSPVGNYQPSTVSVLEMTNPVLIPAGAIRPHLRFYTRWELEENYDYVMVTAANNNQYEELCGRYTEAGNGNQPFGSPVFDGAQYGWVEECMDLSAFAGQPVSISFILGADGGVSLDGFYFDDLQIAYLDSTISAVVTMPLEDFRLLPNQPNPASGSTLLRWENPSGLTAMAELRVFDALGRPIHRQSINLTGVANQLKLDTGAWAPGVYTYYFQWEDQVSAPMKMTILK